MSDDFKVKVTEKISHNFRRKWLISGLQIVLLMIILLVGYIIIFNELKLANLPEFDVTKNRIYTLSDASKKVISKIDSEVKIYTYGYTEDSYLHKFLKQYANVNNLITFKALNPEEDLTLINEYSLTEGYNVVIIKTENSEKIIDSTDFSTYDYNIGDYIDTTEEKLTNSILSLVEENKPKIYFTTGHDEYTVENELYFGTSLLQNEAFLIDSINLFSAEAIPEDCNIIAIMRPKKDFLEAEVNLLTDFINRGGSIFYATAVFPSDTTFPNLQKVLDLYGVSVENGFVIEYDSDRKGPSSYPYILFPVTSSENEITADISSDGFIVLAETARLKFKSEEELEALNTSKEVLLSSTELAKFIKGVDAENYTNELLTAPEEVSDISAVMEKTITNEGEEEKTSKLVISASAAFLTDTLDVGVSQQYPLSYMGSNKDFLINAMSYLGNKNYILSIRKDYNNNTYLPTDTQNAIVLTIIFVIPLFIIISGIVIWNYRRKRK